MGGRGREVIAVVGWVPRKRLRAVKVAVLYRLRWYNRLPTRVCL